MLRPALVLLVLALPSAAQKSRPVTSQSRPATQPASRPSPRNDPAARRYLQGAARTQLPGGTEFQLRGFSASLNVNVIARDEGGSRARSRSGEVSWRYRLKRGRTTEAYYRHLASLDGTVVEVAFLRRQRTLKEKGGNVIDLGDPAYKEDREQLDNELRQVRQLAGLLLLKDLLRKDARVAFGKAGIPVPTQRGSVATREVLWSCAGERPLSICIGIKDGYVYQVTQQADASSRLPARTLRFSHHAYRKALPDSGENFERILLPRVVRFLEDGKLVMTASARRVADLQLNPRFKRSSFRISR